MFISLVTSKSVEDIFIYTISKSEAAVSKYLKFPASVLSTPLLYTSVL